MYANFTAYGRVNTVQRVSPKSTLKQWFGFSTGSALRHGFLMAVMLFIVGAGAEATLPNFPRNFTRAACRAFHAIRFRL